MPPRGANWKVPEIGHLVELVGENMPTKEEHWEALKELHDIAFPTNRSVTALQNKFKDTYRTKMPTGDPTMPDYVRRAKEIHRDYIEMSNGSDGEDDESVEEGGGCNNNGNNIDELVVNDGDEEDEDDFFADANDVENPIPQLPPLLTGHSSSSSRPNSRASNTAPSAVVATAAAVAATTAGALSTAAAVDTTAGALSTSQTRRPRASPPSLSSRFIQQINDMGRKKRADKKRSVVFKVPGKFTYQVFECIIPQTRSSNQSLLIA